MDAIIQVSGLTLQHQGNLVLQDVNFQIGKGEFVYLIGRTGSGKSTLLKSLYADMPIAAGHVQVAGFQLGPNLVPDVPQLRRKVGIIFQDFQLFYDRSVTDNLSFVLRATGWTDAAKIKKRIAEVLMMVGLSSSDQRMPHQLSGGEQQRLVIARAMLNDPMVLIADEPTGNLDPEVSRGIMQLFRQINKSGTAIVMATHNYYLIKENPSRVLQVNQGKLIEATASAV